MIARYLLAWVGMVVIAVINGSLRQFTYGKYLSDLRAHQLSTVTAIVFFALYIHFIDRVWPFPSARDAMIIGAVWLVLTVAFEFGLGRATGKPWSVLFADYDLMTGHLWALIPLWVAAAPYVMYRLRRG